jgi:hypothetical protein
MTKQYVGTCRQPGKPKTTSEGLLNYLGQPSKGKEHLVSIGPGSCRNSWQ